MKQRDYECPPQVVLPPGSIEQPSSKLLPEGTGARGWLVGLVAQRPPGSMLQPFLAQRLVTHAQIPGWLNAGEVRLARPREAASHRGVVSATETTRTAKVRRRRRRNMCGSFRETEPAGLDRPSGRSFTE